MNGTEETEEISDDGGSVDGAADGSAGIIISSVEENMYMTCVRVRVREKYTPHDGTCA